MPLKERISQFKVDKKYLGKCLEEEYHDGLIDIHVVNQDPDMPYWFRQYHPFVFADHYHLVGTNEDTGKVSFSFAISGSMFSHDQYQHIRIEMKQKSAIHLMQQLKEALDFLKIKQNWKKQEEEKKKNEK